MSAFVEYVPTSYLDTSEERPFASESIDTGKMSTYVPHSRMSAIITTDEHGFIAIGPAIAGGPVALTNPSHRMIANVPRRFEIQKDDVIAYLATGGTTGGTVNNPPPPTLTAPTNITPPTYNTTGPVEGQVINLSNFTTGEWTGNPVPTYTYTLKVNNVDKAFPYTCVANDVLVLSVKAENSVGTASATSIPTAPATAAPAGGGGGGTTTPDSMKYANASNTGPWPSVLADIPASYTVGDVTLSTPGMVYEKKRMTGTIRVMANNIKIRNCIIKGNGGYGIFIDKSVSGTIVHNCKIFGDGVNDMAAGIGGCGHFENNDISVFENGINVEGWRDTKIIRNYIHAPWSNPSNAHKDAIQIFGEDAANGGMGPVYVAANCVMMDNQTQDWVNANIYTANTFGPCHDIMVCNNYVAGDAGYPMYYSGQGSGAMTNVVYKDNYIGRGFWGYLYDVVGTAGADVTYTNNIETSTPVPVTSAPWIGTNAVTNNFPDPGAGTGVDTTPPTITSSATANVVSGTAFSRDLTANETVTWSIVAGAPSPDAAKFTLTGATLAMTAKDVASPTDADANNTYIVTVRATDTAGNTTDQQITVTVVAAATQSTLFGTTVPPSFEHNDSGGILISNGTELYFTSSGHIKSVKFYWANQNGNASPSGTVGISDGATGVILAQQDYSGLTGAAAWVTIDLATPLAVTANKKYKTIMEQPRGSGTSRFHYPSDTAFSSSAHTSSDGKVVAPARGSVVNGETYNSGVYDYSSTGIVSPSSTFASEGYWTDVVFISD